MNRSTAIGREFRRDPETARQAVLRALRRSRGNVKAASVELGYRTKRQLWRLIWREGLWTDLDALRARHGSATRRHPADSPPPLLARAQEVLARRDGPC